jgi:orotate phosphoribosyltransferase
MNNQEENAAVWSRLEEIEAFVDNSHVVYTSGKHGRAYVNIARAFNLNDLAVWFAQNLAPLIEHLKFDTLVGPVNSDDKVAYALGDELFRRYGRKICKVYAQRQTRKLRPEGETQDVEAIVPGKFQFARQQEDFVRGRKIVIVCDVLNTGGTLDGVIEAVHASGGIIVAILVVCNRGQHKGSYTGIELIEMMNVPMEAWDPPCELCKAGVSVNTKVGHGRQFLESQSRGAGVIS